MCSDRVVSSLLLMQYDINKKMFVTFDGLVKFLLACYRKGRDVDRRLKLHHQHVISSPRHNHCDSKC
jgi:hypothetical protein